MIEQLRSGDDLHALRKILLAPELRRLEAIERQVSLLEQTLKSIPSAEDVSKVLPEAVRMNFRTSQELAVTFGPVMESAMESSIARGRDKMVAALYPILGALIRKNVVQGIKDAIKSINVILERALSMEGLKWRWESFRTGIPVAQIAFKHSIIFRVEHIFLIHKKTAVPLSHLSFSEDVETDKVVFSGMVGAVTDFVKDTFSHKEPLSLRAIEVSGFTVWFEEGTDAIGAVMVRGEPQPSLRARLRKVLDQLEHRYPLEIKEAMVDEISVTGYESVLRDGLLQLPRDPGKKMASIARWATVSIGVVLLGCTAIYSQRAWRQHVRSTNFERLVGDIKENKDVLLANYGRHENGKYFVRGIIEGTREPSILLKDYGFKPDDLDFTWVNQTYFTDPIGKSQQLQILSDELKALDGLVVVRGPNGVDQKFIDKVATQLADAYVRGKTFGRTFVVVIEHPKSLKTFASRLTGDFRWELYRRGVYDWHLVRRLTTGDSPLVLRILEERRSVQ